jgi:hypothetical protein
VRSYEGKEYGNRVQRNGYASEDTDPPAAAGRPGGSFLGEQRGEREETMLGGGCAPCGAPPALRDRSGTGFGASGRASRRARDHVFGSGPVGTLLVVLEIVADSVTSWQQSCHWRQPSSAVMSVTEHANCLKGRLSARLFQGPEPWSSFSAAGFWIERAIRDGRKSAASSAASRRSGPMKPTA